MSTSIPYVSGTTTFANANYIAAGSPANVTLGDGWTILGASAFRGATGLTSITIPNSVTTIETRAFQGATGLTSITIPSSVRTISSHAFSYASGLTSITIPSSVTSFSGNVFSFATGLKTAIFPSSISSIPISTFYKATGLTSFTIPSSVKSIGDSAFSYATSLTSIIIPNSVTNIDRWAFYGSTGLTSVTLSSSITKIGIYMFYDTRLTSITIPNSVTIIEEFAFYNTRLPSITIPSSVTSIGENAFELVSTLSSITIPSSVISIGSNAFLSSGITTAIFQESTLLDKLTPSVIPGTGKTLYGKSGITVSWITKVLNGTGSLTNSASSLLNGATKVKIAGYTNIGGSIFWYTSSLTSVTISSSLTSISRLDWIGGTPLTEIIVDPSNNNYTSINNVLLNKAQTSLVLYPTGSTATTYTIPSTVTSIGDYALYFARNLKLINLNNIITSIGSITFKGSALTSITIPASVTSIGSYVFDEIRYMNTYIVDASNNYYSSDSYGALFDKNKTLLMYYPGANTSNTSYTIPSTVISMADGYNFFGASTLTSITIPFGVTKINRYTFGHCSNLTNITLPDSLADMSDSYYFYYATNLTSITIPASVTTIGTYAFGYSNITSAIFEESTLLDGLAIIPGTDKTLYGKSGIYVSWLTKVFNGSGSLTGATALLYGATKARIETHTSIGASAFLNATALTSITIPSSVTSIGGSAFQGSGITRATFEESTLLDGLGITCGPNKTLYDKSSMSIYLSYKVFNGTGQLTSTIVNDNGLSYVRNLTITGFSSIGASVFQYATEITSLTIPSSVTSIGPNAFLNSGLTSAIFTVNTDVSRFGITLSKTPQTFFGKTGVTVSALDTKIFRGTSHVSLSGATALLDEKTNVVIEGYTQIGFGAFQNASNITSITIPNGVTTIGSNAFQNATSLTSITIPASVNNIGTSVFQNALSLTSINVNASNTTYYSDNGVLYNSTKTQLIQYPVGNTQTSYTILSTVTTINTYAFQGAKNLKLVTLPDTSTFVSIELNAFQGATGLESITIPSAVTSIGDYAFAGATSLTTVNYAGTSMLKTINGYVFQNATSLTSITIPASVTFISANTVFQKALSLTSINVDPNNPNYSSDSYGVLYNKDKTTMLQYPVGSSQTSYTIPNTMTVTFNWYMFQGANNLKSVILPSNFTNISNYAFAGATGLESITIPSTVTNIGDYAFLGATSLKTVTFTGTSTLKTIGQNAFQNATSLTSITIPASVTSISTTSVFQNALSLTSINVDQSNTTYYSDNGVLYNNPSRNTLIQYPVGNTQTSYTIPSTVTSIIGNAFYGANNLKSVTLPDTSTFTSIASNAFYYATGLTSITIPSRVLHINSSAFLGATSLTTVTFDGTPTLTTIGNNAFQNATSLTSITIPRTVNSIGTTAVFQNATSLTSIIVDPSNTSFSDISGVLYNAAKNSLIQYPLGNTQTSYTIPSSVTGFASTNVFQGAKYLTNFTSNSSNYSTDSYGVLYNSSKRTLIQYPCGNTQTSYTIPSMVTNISTYAFQLAKYLQSINVDPMNTIYSSDSNGVLFNKAKTNLIQYPLGNTQTTYSIPVNVTNIFSYAFQNVTNLTSVTIQTPINGTTIQDYAFQNATSLNTIIIPNSVTSIGFKAFQGSGLTSAKLESAINYPVYAIQNKSTPQYFLGKENVVASIILPYLVLNGSGELTSTIVSSILNNYSTVIIITGYSSIGTSAFLNATGLTSIIIPSSVTSIGTSAFENTDLTTVFFESASTVKKLGLLNGDLINGYTVSSFYGKASVTFIYTKAVRSTISAAPTAIISNNTFTSLLTNMGMNISNITSQVIPITNDPYIEYSAKLTIPNGNLSTLSDVNKANIIDTVKSLYAAQLGINLNKIIVTLESGSIIANVNVLKDGITDAMVPICFPKGTPVTTNQGVIAIDQLNPDIHTIRGKKIVAITQTKPNFEHIIAIDKNALGKNVPSAPIQISKEHKVCYKREMVKANDLVEVCEGVRRIPYNGETLYNVLMEKHDKMMINNLICETLDPDNIMAKICGGKYNRYEQSNICKELNDIMKENNVKAYIKLYDSLK